MTTIVIDGAAVVTVDPERREFTGHVVVEGNRIVAVGPGPAPAYDGARVIDGRDVSSHPASSTRISICISG